MTATSKDASPVVFLGDGHVEYFRVAQKNHLFAPRAVDIYEVGGATAVAMRNPLAMKDAIALFRKFLEDKSKQSIIVLHFGEADCGFVFWHRAQGNGEPIETQLAASIDAYCKFVDELLALGFQHVIVAGVTPPVVGDEEVAGARGKPLATQQERTALTKDYNAKLQAAAVARGLSYVDVATEVTDPQTGMVYEALRTPGWMRLKFGPAAVAWAARLNPVLQKYQPIEAPWMEWRATEASSVKALLQTNIQDLKRPTQKDSLLFARLNATVGNVVVISDAVLDGEKLDTRLRLLEAVNWKELAPVLELPEASDFEENLLDGLPEDTPATADTEIAHELTPAAFDEHEPMPAAFEEQAVEPAHFEEQSPKSANAVEQQLASADFVPAPATATATANAPLPPRPSFVQDTLRAIAKFFTG